MAAPARSLARPKPPSPRPLSPFQRWILGGLLLLLALLVLHISLGSVMIAPLDVFRAVIDQPTDDVHRTIVWNLRMPRALIAILAGAMLGLSGAILQSITHNPLASPALTGVIGGGVLAAALFIAFAPNVWQDHVAFPLVSISGGILSGGTVYALSWHHGTNPLRLTLTGVLMASILTAGTSLVLIIDQSNLGNILHWMIGSLNGRAWAHWWMLLPYAVVSLPLGMLAASLANVLYLGDDVARGLGLPLERARAALLMIAVLLAAGAVSIVGNIAFIGLIAPHLARSLVGADHRRLFPFSALLAALLLLAADILARTVTLYAGSISDSAEGVGNLPVGAVTAILGATFFFYLLMRKRV